MRYCIWNNKGGVGKTFLTYSLATEYASRHPEKSVVVVDMCPQANVSEMLLGGNGTGEENLATCFENNRTIASYIKKRYDQSKFGRLGDETTYFVPVEQYNKEMPANLYLLPGDNDLDICAGIIDYLAQAPQRGAWMTSRRFLDDLISVFENSRKGEKTFFIDTNPSFANYTQLALIASQRMIVPCSADPASMRGIFNLFRLIFGIRSENNDLKDDGFFDTFSDKLRDSGLLPKIHMFVLNKARTLNKRASKAYQSHVEEIRKVAEEIAAKHPAYFTDKEEEQQRIIDLKDCNTIAPVMSHNGLPPSRLQHKKYPLFRGEKETQVNQSQIDSFMEALKDILANLD